jgi:Putative Ig domain
MGRMRFRRLVDVAVARALTVTTALLLALPAGPASAQNAAPPLAIEGISPPMLTVGKQGQPYSDLVTATGGTAPYHWSATGLPRGLIVRETMTSTWVTTAAVRGTPEQDGPFSLDLEVTDSSGQESNEHLELEILGPYMTVPTPVLDDAIKGEAYKATVGVEGGLPPLHFMVRANADIPPGLSVGPAGDVVGTPTTPGRYRFVVFVTDSSYFPQKIAPTVYITVAVQCGGSLTPSTVDMCVGGKA